VNNKYIDMKKFNGFEAYLILEGLKEVAASMKEGIEKNIKFNLYWKESNKYNRIMVSYEDLHKSPVTTIKSVCDFLDYNISIELITKAINENTFEKMRNKEIEGMQNIDEKSLKTRVGKIGGYINHLSEDDIKYCNDLLEKYNYFDRMQ
jgi:hypothetical protein